MLTIALEALSNAAAHAAATRVALRLAPDENGWLLWVEDDGRGLEDGVNPGTGLGVSNMRRRAEAIVARLARTRGRDAHGTRVELRFPA